MEKVGAQVMDLPDDSHGALRMEPFPMGWIEAPILLLVGYYNCGNAEPTINIFDSSNLRITNSSSPGFFFPFCLSFTF